MIIGMYITNIPWFLGFILFFIVVSMLVGLSISYCDNHGGKYFGKNYEGNLGYWWWIH
jgi:5-bromo-4-chloroindolyl phosphate hydrolysis protein